jgi:hypothetical protein
MNKVSAFVVCLLLSVVSATGAFAESVVFDAAKLEIAVPAGWAMSKASPHLIRKWRLCSWYCLRLTLKRP